MLWFPRAGRLCFTTFSTPSVQTAEDPGALAQSVSLWGGRTSSYKADPKKRMQFPYLPERPGGKEGSD